MTAATAIAPTQQIDCEFDPAGTGQRGARTLVAPTARRGGRTRYAIESTAPRNGEQREMNGAEMPNTGQFAIRSICPRYTEFGAVTRTPRRADLHHSSVTMKDGNVIQLVSNR